MVLQSHSATSAAQAPDFPFSFFFLLTFRRRGGLVQALQSISSHIIVGAEKPPTVRIVQYHWGKRLTINVSREGCMTALQVRARDADAGAAHNKQFQAALRPALTPPSLTDHRR